MPHNVQCKKCYHLQNDWCKEKVDSPDPDLVRDCQYFRTATNADRIRAYAERLGADVWGHPCDKGMWDKFIAALDKEIERRVRHD